MKAKYIKSEIFLVFLIFFLFFCLQICSPSFATELFTRVNKINGVVTINEPIKFKDIDLSDILPKPTPPEKHKWAPSVTRLLNVPDFNVEKGTIIVQSEFIDFGRIRESSPAGDLMIVNSGGQLYDFAVGVTNNIELYYAKAKFNIDTNTITYRYIGSKEFNGDLYSVKLAKKLSRSKQKNKTTNFGVIYSYLKNNITDITIAQAGIEKRTLNNVIITGLSLSDIQNGNKNSSVSGFIGIRQNISNTFDFTLEYSYKHPLKLILNKVIKTEWHNLGALSCENCKEDALSIGVNFKLGEKGAFNLYILDVDDLICPMAQTIVKF